MMDDPDDDGLISRPYQSQLEEIASKKNTIIYLPTGSGKTFIAIRLIGRFKHSLNGVWGQGAKRTFFLVNTVPLVKQQQKCISILSPVKKVGGYSSEHRVDFWNKKKWDEELCENEVVVMTCQILCDMITHSYISISDINLLIFDECHHGIDDHPMRLLMKHFESCPKEDQPRVVGLTATLLNSNVNLFRVEETLRSLETTFHATIATVNELGEVLTYSTNPYEVVQFYDNPKITSTHEEAFHLLSKLEDMIISVNLPNSARKTDVELKGGQFDITTDPKRFLFIQMYDGVETIVKCVKNMVISIKEFIEELGLYGGNISLLAYIILLEQLKRSSKTIEESLLYQFTITHLIEVRMILCNVMKSETGYKKIIKFSSEKVVHLLNILREYSPDVINSNEPLEINRSRQSLSAIIFTKKRFTAKVLYNLLKDVIEMNRREFGFLKHDFVVGFNVNPFNNTREQFYAKKQSQQAILKFTNKDLNCLISTSIIEEGIDIPQCLLVLRFDPPLEYRSFIQSKGRARSPKSSFVILINTQDKMKFMNTYKEFKKIEQFVQKMLIGKTERRYEPSGQDIKNSLYEDDQIPPYVTPSGNRLSPQSAISLLNRYCGTLPHDRFTFISPMWISERLPDKNIVVTLLLPLACPIKEPIKGRPMGDIKWAKRSAALNACILLHKVEELDPISLLPQPYSKVNFGLEDIKECFLNWPWGEDNFEETEDAPAVGTKKRIRKHPKVYPQLLDGPSNWMYGQQMFYLHIIDLNVTFEEPKDSRERALYKLLKRDEGYGFLTTHPLPKLCDFPMFLSVGEVMTSIKINYAKIQLTFDLFQAIKEFHFFVFDQVLEVAKKFVVFDGTKNSLYVVPVKVDNGYDIDWDVIQQYKEVPPIAVPSTEERKALHVTRENYQYKVVTPWYRATIFPDRYIVSDVLEYMSPQSHFDTDTFKTYEGYYWNKYVLEVEGDKTNLCSRVHMLLVAEELRIEIVKGTGYGKVTLDKDENWLPVKVDLQVAIKSLLSQVESPDDEMGALKNTVDRINNPIDETARKPLKLISMKDSVYQLQKQKIDKEYPWEESKEPIDIERNISTVTVMDIECYDEFINTHMFTIPYDIVVGPEITPGTSAAILPPPIVYNDKIALLSKSPVGRGPEQRDILTSLTTIKSHDNFNMERTETLGDSFLKFAASIYLYHKFPMLNEGQLTNIKSRLIGNRNLYYAGENVRLGGRIKVEGFSPRSDFVVPGFLAPEEVKNFIEKIKPSFLFGMQFSLQEALSGKLSSESCAQIQKRFTECDGAAEKEPQWGAQNSMQCYVATQVLHDKAVADCVESIIGTYLLHGGVLGAIKVIEWMKIIPAQHNLALLLHEKISTPLTEKKATNELIAYFLNHTQDDIEEILNYKFKDASILLEALSHPSYIRNRCTRSYERLEFLGDAILDFLITSHIFELCEDFKPGDLTDLRSALVNNVTFAAYVVKLGLQKYLCSQLNPVLDNSILAFVEHQQQRDHEIVEDILYLIEEEECQIAEYVEVPKTLSDIFESLAGAIYLDSGGSLETVWAVVYRIMHKEINAFSKRIPRQPVAVLCEMIYACPKFQTATVIPGDIPKVMVPVTFTKDGGQHTVYGVGTNKCRAKRAASKLALKVLGC